MDEAVEHFVKAEDFEGAARVVEQNRHEVLDRDRWYELEKWLERIPMQYRHNKPGLLLAQAWVYYYRFTLKAIPPILDALEGLTPLEEPDRPPSWEKPIFSGAINCFGWGA